MQKYRISARTTSLCPAWAIYSGATVLLLIAACQQAAGKPGALAVEQVAAAAPKGGPSAAGNPAQPSTEVSPADLDPPKTKEPMPTTTDIAPDEAFPYRAHEKAPEFPTGLDWLNTAKPIRLSELRGKFVVIDFWTYCCINCMHILPELKKLEHKYPNNVVVIGCHSAKFDTEKGTKNIRDAILRYEIEHPVVNDAEHRLWDTFDVSSWPTMVVIDPEGNKVGMNPGEIKFEDLEAFILKGLPYYRKRGSLDEKPLHFPQESEKLAASPLKFPGKLAADEKGDRLFIADTGHNRIIVTSLAGKTLAVIGSGASGAADGDYAQASFFRPNGLALAGETLYVADTENHLLRKVDLKEKKVTTIAGTGSQAHSPWPGLEKLHATTIDELPERWIGKPLETGLSSPWALAVLGKDLYIAMAGPHQIWKMPLDESEIGPYAGNGREDIVDGPLVPRTPYAKGFASFAQPSGLASDGTWLYVADSEGSSIRAVPLASGKEVRTVIGTADLYGGRLFTFGDVDGGADKARLQHPLDVAYAAGKIYVADTYNSKIKVVNAATGETRTFAGSGKASTGKTPADFDEPEGLAIAAGKLYVADTNHHAIRTIDLADPTKITTLALADLAPPTAQPAATATKAKKPRFDTAAQVKVEAVTLKAVDGKIHFHVALKVPAGWKINPLGPEGYYVERAGEGTAVAADSLEKFVKLEKPSAEFDIPLAAAAGSDTLKIGVVYFHCESKEDGVCKTGAVQFTVPLKVADDGQAAGELKFDIPE